LEPVALEALRPALMVACAELQSRKATHLGTKLLPLSGSDAMLEEFGFKKVTEEVLMSKTI